MVSNPFCRPCARTHETLEELLTYRDDLQVKVIFATSGQNQAERTKVAQHLGALNLLSDQSVVKNALSDWYKYQHKKYESWIKKYPSDFGDEIDLSSEKQAEWCKMADITFTPTILINGYKLPLPYQVGDLKYLLD